MNVIVCVDNRMGTMFNKRRQSSDRILCEKAVSVLGDARLLLKSYSRPLFEEINCTLIQDENCLSIAQKGDFCFVEGDDLAPFEDKIESLVLFKWNRDYPFDKKLNIDLSKGWKLIQTEEFKGSSHDKITMEIYQKEIVQ